MFTGIIESISEVQGIRKKGPEYVLKVINPFGAEISTGDSISVDGTCLTVVEFDRNSILFFVSEVTAGKTIIANYKNGMTVNLERAMKADGRFDGHIVQGHVDTTGTIRNIRKAGEGVEITVSFDTSFSRLVADRGSVSVNGISLTTAEVSSGAFMISLIPETLKRTSFSKKLMHGQTVNIEFDIIGKYIARSFDMRNGDRRLEDLLGKL